MFLMFFGDIYSFSNLKNISESLSAVVLHPPIKVFDDKVPSVGLYYFDFTLIFIRRKCFKLYRRINLTKCANCDTKIIVLVKNRRKHVLSICLIDLKNNAGQEKK